MYRTIVVPVDGSLSSEGALPLASSLARLAGAKLDLVQVLEPLTIEGSGPWQADLEARTHEYLDLLCEGLEAAGVTRVDTHLLQGSVSERLRRHVDSSGADLVVLATHGRGAPTRAWLGSVADRLARSASVPVLLVRPPQSGSHIPHANDFRRILAPLDGSRESESALGPLLKLAEPLSAAVWLLRVVEDPVPPGLAFSSGAPRDSEERVGEAVDEARAYLAELGARLRERGVASAGQVLVHESPAAAILDHARSNPVDLIAMSTRGRGALERSVLGSVADKVVRASEKPVLVVPHAAGAVA